MKRKFILLIITLSNFSLFAQTLCLTEYEASLYKHVNELRLSKGLLSIQISRNLTIVAQTHAKDLSSNHPQTAKCNMHSWSNKGKWKSCCYTDDHKRAEGMWNKPRELTNYKGNGYEIAFYTSDLSLKADDFAKEALKSWLNSPGHSIVILNKGMWKNSHWNAIGVGVWEGYAVIWFGEDADNEIKPETCN